MGVPARAARRRPPRGARRGERGPGAPEARRRPEARRDVLKRRLERQKKRVKRESAKVKDKAQAKGNPGGGPTPAPAAPPAAPKPSAAPQQVLYNKARRVCQNLTLTGLAQRYNVAATPEAVATAYAASYPETFRQSVHDGCIAAFRG